MRRSEERGSNVREIFIARETRKHKGIHLLLIALGCILTYFMDAQHHFTYGERAGIKVGLFFVLPVIYALFVPRFDLFSIFRRTKGDDSFKKSLVLGLLVYVSLLVLYILIRDFIDLETIESTMAANMMITKENFIVIAIYISFINSLLEEFFFRGFAFLKLKKRTGRFFAYGVSSFAFAIYHFSIIDGWVNPLLTFLGLLGLFLSGVFFNFLNERNDNIFNSYMVHMFANFAINTIGLQMFGIINLPFLG